MNKNYYLIMGMLLALLAENICSAAKSSHDDADDVDDVEQGEPRDMEDQEETSAAVENSRATGDGGGISIQYAPNVIHKKADLLQPQFFNEETKTLSLSGLKIENSDATLKLLFYGKQGESDSPEGPLFNLLETNAVENLNLENMGLTEVPLYLIAYALANQGLRYVTLKHNNFNIPGFSTCPIPAEPEKKPQTETRARRRSCDLSCSRDQLPISSHILENRSALQKGGPSRGMAAAAAQFTAGILQDILPMAEQALQAQHEGKGIQIFKTVVEIDEHIPPITVVDQRILPLIRPGGWRAAVMKICTHAIGVAGGLFVGLLPYIATALYREYGGGGGGGGNISSSTSF